MALLGIDLGTSNSLVGYYNEEKVELIPNVFGDFLTPSVVGIGDNNELLIGKLAKERAVAYPEKTFTVFKRMMGSKKKYHYEEHTFTPTELSSMILLELKKDAEEYLQESCNQAIISVPAYFNNTQRQATIDAAKLAGLEVIKLISEPTAAALSYGIHQFRDDNTIIVLDLGGGTFDVSIMEMFDGVLQVLAIAGNNMLGGEDFTNIIIDDFLSKNDIIQGQLSTQERASIYKQCEKIKHQIYSNTNKTFKLNIAGKSYDYQLYNLEYRDLCRPLFMKIKMPIIKALHDADITINDIDSIILMGGATRMAIFKDFAELLFEQNVKIDVDPDRTVAYGSILACGMHQRNENLDEMILTDVCGYSLGVSMVVLKNDGSYEDDVFSPIINRNSPIPISRVESYSPVEKSQDQILFDVYQGESRDVKNNLKLGEILVKLPRKGNDQAVNVRFTYDVSGVIEVIAEIEETKALKKLIIRNDGCTLSDHEVALKLEQLAEYKVHPREKQENSLLLARAAALYEYCNNSARDEIGNKIAEFEESLSTQDDFKIKKARIEFEEWLNYYEKDIESVLLGHSSNIIN